MPGGTATGRRLALLGGLLLLAAPALAQEAPAPEAAEPRPAPRPPRRPRRSAAAKPQPPEPAKQPPALPPSRTPIGPMQTDIAPMPNRDLEGPRVATQDRTRIGPTVMDRNLPGRGMATEGSPGQLEDKLFKPGPGAQLRVPFSY